jgi:hypothetical protein
MKGVRLVRGSIISGWVGDAGAQFLVEDDVAAEAVASGLLEYTPGDEHNTAVPVYDPDADSPIQHALDEVPEDERPREMTIEERYAELSDGTPAEPEELKRPYGNRPKSEWVDYAISKGHDPDEATGLTKADLMSLYGERL